MGHILILLTSLLFFSCGNEYKIHTGCGEYFLRESANIVLHGRAMTKCKSEGFDYYILKRFDTHMCVGEGVNVEATVNCYNISN